MFSMVRAFPITSFGSNGLPVISTGYPLLALDSDEQELNNIDISLTKVTRTKTYAADNREEVNIVKTSYEGTISCYGFGPEAMAALTENELDSEGRLMFVGSSDGAPKCVVFFKGRDAKGKEYNMWIYNCEFQDPDLSAAQEGDTPATVSVNFNASSVVYSGRKLFMLAIYEGQEGYLAEGVEPTAADLPVPTVSA